MIDDQPNLFADFAAAPANHSTTQSNRPGRNRRNGDPTGNGQVINGRFVTANDKPTGRVRKALIRLLCIGIAIAGLAFAGSHTQRFLIARIAAGLDSQVDTQRQKKLIQIASFGSAAVPALVGHLANGNDNDVNVCQNLLTELQNSWTTLPIDQRLQNHQILIASLDREIEGLMDDRTDVVRSLLRQSMNETVGQTGLVATKLSGRIGALISQLSVSAVNDKSLAATEGRSKNSSPLPALLRQTGRSVPLLHSPLPIEPETENSRHELLVDASHSPDSDSKTVPLPINLIRGTPIGMRPIESETAVLLRPASEIPPQRQLTAGLRPTAYADPTVDDQSIANSSDPFAGSVPPMMALADASVFVYFHHDQGRFAADAELELRDRGYNSGQIEMAKRVSSPDVESRLAVIEQLPHLTNIDPRPWLKHLIGDTHREVRLRTISVIATMNDPAAQSLLRTHLASETDPVVSARLRRHLNLR